MSVREGTIRRGVGEGDMYVVRKRERTSVSLKSVIYTTCTVMYSCPQRTRYVYVTLRL